MTRRVRTPEGAKFYGLPIGSPIVDGPNLPSARSLTGMKRKSKSTDNYKDARLAAGERNRERNRGYEIVTYSNGRGGTNVGYGRRKEDPPTGRQALLVASRKRRQEAMDADGIKDPRAAKAMGAARAAQDARAKSASGRRRISGPEWQEPEFQEIVEQINAGSPDDEQDIMDWIKGSDLSARAKGDLVRHMKQTNSRSRM